MSPSVPHPITPATLPDSLLQRLNKYAVAASAAGVGMLVATPVQAKIVYTPAHLRIPPNSSIQLDLNHDGINDFSFNNVYKNYTNPPPGLDWDELKVSPLRQGDKVWMTGNTSNWWGYPPAFPAGHWIGRNRNFRFQAGYMAFGYRFGTNKPLCAWPWTNVSDRYLAVQVSVKGRLHYGWARLSVACSQTGAVTGTLTGYAYETIPNKSIRAGRKKGADVIVMPPTLGRLAGGAAAISTWRTRQSTTGPSH